MGEETSVELTGAQALVKSLESEGVEVVFGLPGGAILPVYDPILDSSIRHILVRHEQGAGHAAEGYALVTGRAGVAMVTSGPGATNIVTPIADAFLDSVPLVVITGQVSTSAIGTDAFQEVDTTGITTSITKHNWLITDPAEIARTVKEAFHVATTGRPGPVVVDVPKDVAQAKTTWPESVEIELPGYRLPAVPDPAAIAAAAALISQASRPVLYVGGGVLKANAAEVLAQLVERTGFPVVTTLMARGAFPDSDPHCLGMPGMHGTYAAVTAMQRADLLVALGARFDDRVTGKVSSFAPQARVVHLDVDKAEIGKVRRPDVAITADCRAGIEALVRRLDTETTDAALDPQRLEPWWTEIETWRVSYPLHYDAEAPPDSVKPQFVVEQLRAATPDDTILVSGVGQHQMWAAQHWRFDHPRTWVNSGGLGTMGFAIPAAIGAKVGRPDRMVWAVDGDGCFQMTAQELITASTERVPVKIAILNNAYLGMVRQWQHMFYDERYSSVYLSSDVPDYVRWAEAMGCVGFKVTSPDEVRPTIEKANAVDDKPVVIDFRTDPQEHVYPMVAAGASNDDIVVHPSLTRR
jgi:acetolactate synthase I/II/III large subunit